MAGESAGGARKGIGTFCAAATLVGVFWLWGESLPHSSTPAHHPVPHVTAPHKAAPHKAKAAK